MAEEYFDWVTVLHNCDLRLQFANLTNEATANVKTYNRVLGSNRIQVHWDREQSPDVCTVSRPGGASVEFSLQDDGMTVRCLSSNKVEKTIKLQVRLDSQGECVLFRGRRRILRWHLLREVLAPLFGYEKWD